MRLMPEATRSSVHPFVGSGIDGASTCLLAGGFGFTVAAQLVVLLWTEGGPADAQEETGTEQPSLPTAPNMDAERESMTASAAAGGGALEQRPGDSACPLPQREISGGGCCEERMNRRP